MRQRVRTFPSRCGQGTKVKKNCEPFVSGPAFAMLSRPGRSCFIRSFSSCARARRARDPSDGHTASWTPMRWELSRHQRGASPNHPQEKRCIIGAQDRHAHSWCCASRVAGLVAHREGAAVDGLATCAVAVREVTALRHEPCTAQLGLHCLALAAKARRGVALQAHKRSSKVAQ